MPLNVKRKKFIKHYVKTGNKRESAIIAGYSPRSAHSTANELLNNPEIKGEITRVLDGIGLTDTKLGTDLKTAIDKGVASDRITLADGLRGIEMALKLKDKFPAERKQIDTRSISYSLKGKSIEELQERYNELLGEAREYKQIEP